MRLSLLFFFLSPLVLCASLAYLVLLSACGSKLLLPGSEWLLHWDVYGTVWLTAASGFSVIPKSTSMFYFPRN